MSEIAQRSWTEPTPDELVRRHLGSEADFWSNVQEPSLRLRDPQLILRLSNLAYDRFKTPRVLAASAVITTYRLIEGVRHPGLDPDEVRARLRTTRSSLNRGGNVYDFRWYLSSILAEVALTMHLRRLPDTAAVLRLEEETVAAAVEHGQLYTNVVKLALLRLCFSLKSSFRFDSPEDISRDLSTVLSFAGHAPGRYKFDNEFAYEELAAVFTMLRQIKIWIVSVSEKKTVSVPATDFAKALNDPFRSLVAGLPRGL